MAAATRFEDLIIWQIARLLNLQIFTLTKKSPWSGDQILTNQIRRAALSVMSNIAEGFERNGNKEFVRFLSIAKASAGEVRSQLYVGQDLGYLDSVQAEEVRNKWAELSSKISGLMKYLDQSGSKSGSVAEPSTEYGFGDQSEMVIEGDEYLSTIALNLQP